MDHLRHLDDHAHYRIRVYGFVGQQWSEYLQDFTINASDMSEYVVTTLSGEVQDQAALIGVINTLYQMGHGLISVERQTDSGKRS